MPYVPAQVLVLAVREDNQILLVNNNSEVRVSLSFDDVLSGYTTSLAFENVAGQVMPAAQLLEPTTRGMVEKKIGAMEIDGIEMLHCDQASDGETSEALDTERTVIVLICQIKWNNLPRATKRGLRKQISWVPWQEVQFEKFSTTPWIKSDPSIFFPRVSNWFRRQSSTIGKPRRSTAANSQALTRYCPDTARAAEARQTRYVKDDTLGIWCTPAVKIGGHRFRQNMVRKQQLAKKKTEDGPLARMLEQARKLYLDIPRRANASKYI